MKRIHLGVMMALFGMFGLAGMSVVHAAQPLNVVVPAGESYRVPFDRQNFHSIKVIFANRFDGPSVCKVNVVKDGNVLEEGQIGTEEYRTIHLVRKNFMLERSWHPGQDIDEFAFEVTEGEMRLRIFFIEH
jgi:hypothetical protein